MSTKVSEVGIIPLKPNENGLLAIASCIVDDKFYLGSLGLYIRFEKDKDGGYKLDENNKKIVGGYRITYPNKKVGPKPINIYHPITKECGDTIENAVIAKYEELMGKDY